MRRNNLNKYKKTLAIICATIAFAILLTGCDKQETSDADTVKHEGTEYVFLEYPVNVFYYDYNGNSNDNFEDEDGMYPIKSPQWKMIWNGGDLYCAKDDVDEATSYYADDENYNWYVVIDSEDEEESNSHSIEMTDTELEDVYNLEVMKKDIAVYFDEFEALGSIIKISKDSVVRGILSIAKYDGAWYWKSEVIDESRD